MRDAENRDEGEKKTLCVQAGKTEAGTPTWRQRKTNKQTGMLVHRSLGGEGSDRTRGGGGVADAAEGLRWRTESWKATGDTAL